MLCVLRRLAAVQSELTLVQTQQREQTAKREELAEQVSAHRWCKLGLHAHDMCAPSSTYTPAALLHRRIG
jgi:hypothetical protein